MAGQLGTAWCSHCRRRSAVEDESLEYANRPWGEVEYVVQWLDCRHTSDRETGITGPAPGAPVGLPRSYALAVDNA